MIAGEIMKKKNKAFFAVILALAIIGTGVMVYADQNETPDHSHDYKVATFDGNEASLICQICGAETTDRFDSHINEENYAPLDMNGDGIVNAKDYAYLIHHYDSNGPISSWESPGIEF